MKIIWRVILFVLVTLIGYYGYSMYYKNTFSDIEKWIGLFTSQLIGVPAFVFWWKYFKGLIK